MTTPQHPWASKLLGFDFVVEYKTSSLNIVCNALSRRGEHSGEVVALSMLTFAVFDEIRLEINGDAALSQLQDAIRGRAKPYQWSIVDGLILLKGRIFISSSFGLLPAILGMVKGARHKGILKTLHRVRVDFHVPNDHVVIQDFVWAYQHNKSENLQLEGLLQPQDFPSTIWSDVAMDFIAALPRVNGKSVILIVIDRISKATHFITLAHPYTAVSMARVFFVDMLHLHSILASIV